MASAVEVSHPRAGHTTCIELGATLQNEGFIRIHISSLPGDMVMDRHV